LLGSSKGFVSILGTGANSCVFDGKQVQHNIRALGYILGDEGSGSYLGRMLLRDYMRGLMPQEAFVEFENMFQLKGTDILGDLYASIFPNRFLANFAQFATLNNQNEYIKRLVRQGFHDFFTNVVSQYPHYTSEHFNCVGSIGFLFKDILTQTANDFGMEVGNIIQSPIDELVKFHLKQPSSYI
jgi:N-acetylglucosamine kinase-like BadF-type ATPase